VADDADRLYALPLDEFTRERDAAARRLRQEGRRDEASAVAELRKPVLSAWLVNRLARERRKELRALLTAADRLRRGDAQADERFREALEQLTRAARELLVADGRDPSDAIVREVATTLRAGAAESPERLAEGRLTHPFEPTGFGAMVGAAIPSPRRPREKPRDDARRRRAAVEQARTALADARDEARRRGREADEAEREARRLRAAADEADRRLEEAERRLADTREA